MLDGLERIQARNRLLLEEVRQEAQRFAGLLEARTASGGEDLKDELEVMPEKGKRSTSLSCQRCLEERYRAAHC
ncbi:hypothetical protein [Meiothermus sp.]|uniref:hypothetical protein n=1 Tax=Meiothermus sp. TaxID=1955249 RepID=UPI00307EC601